MWKQSFRLFLAALILQGALALPLFAAEVFINIERKKGSLIRVAIPEFSFRQRPDQQTREKALAKIAKDVLSFDLGFCGYFEVIDNNESIKEITRKEKESDNMDWKAWKNLGADSLVHGEYYVNPDKELVVEGRIFDVNRKEQIIGIRYTGTPPIFRKMIHRFADQILFRFTGELGIAETRIAFVSKVNNKKELMVTDYDGQNLVQLTYENSLVLSPAWSPSGGQILFTTYRYKNPDLYGIDLEEGKRFVISKKIGLNASAEWLPDGKNIIFSMSKRGNSDIYIIDTDGKNLERLTFTRSIETSPSMSPDGKMIAYVSDFPGTPQIYIMDIDGKNKSRFTFSGPYNADPAWSPKGDTIAYAGILDNNFNIQVKKVKGKFERQLTIYAGTNESPAWSPDGRHIVFSSSRSGSRQLYIMNANGENQRQITNLPGGAFAPAWSPRGKR